MRVVIKVVWVVALWSGLATAFGVLYLTTAAAIFVNTIAAFALIGFAIWASCSCCVRKETVEDEGEEEELDDTNDIDDEAIDPATLQQWTRVKLPSGGERVDAVIRVDFAAGQQTASLHLPLCPPFPQPLAWELSMLDAADMSLHIARSLTSGVRIDLKRPPKSPAATHWVLASGTDAAVE